MMGGLRLLCGAMLVAVESVAVGADFAVDVGDSGAVNIDVGGVRCLDTFQVILPAPDWKGGATPRDCRKETVAPGHVRVTGVMADPQPCATFTLDSQETGGGLDLAWEIAFTRDFEAETVRLNGYLPCSLAAGKAAWFIARSKGLEWALFPGKYGDPGGSLSAWGFDWFGWLLPGDCGVRFRPQSGLTDMYLQDGRQWNAEHFQTCWTLAGKGTLREGTVLRCAIRLEPLSGRDAAAAAASSGKSLVGLTAGLTPAAKGAEGTVDVRNVGPEPKSLEVQWQIRDDLARVLAEGKQAVTAPALGTVQVAVAAPLSPSGEYRLHVEARPAGAPAAQPQVADQRLVVPPPGLRVQMSLDGTWELATAEASLDAPPEGEWKPTTVPGRISDNTRQHFWCRRQFEVPDSMTGKRLKLRFGAVNHEARVYVNGQLAGSHFGGNLPFEVDATEFVRPGANDLWVAVTSWIAACTKPPTSYEVKPFEHPGWSLLPPGTIIAPIGGDFRLTGIWQSVTLLAVDPVHLEDVFVQTSVRQHTVQATVTLRNESNQPRMVDLAADIADRGGPAKTLPPARVSLAAGETKEVLLKAGWPDAHLWSLDDPHLYRLITSVTEEGKTLDRLGTRFGFRELWTDGPRFVLNGVPLKLFATSGWGMETWDAAYAHIARMKRAGTRCMRLHTQPWQPHILDVADELGMLIVDEAAVYCYQQAYAVKDKRFWMNYADHVRALARRDRNHPSLAMYSLENEILLCGGDAGAWETQLGRLADIVRETDPTRLITCEADLDPAGKMDVIGLHYPREYWSGFTLYPGKCWWMNEPVPYLGREWKWKRDKPLYIGEFDGGFMAWYPQYQAFWLGDEAYTSRGRFSLDWPSSRARRELIKMEVDAYRYYGVAGLNPWFDADEVDVFGPQAYAPVAVSFVQRAHSFYSGQEILRCVIAHNDSLEPLRVTRSWGLTGPGAKPQSGSDAFRLPVCSATEVCVTGLRAPDVKQPTAVTLEVELKQGARVVAQARQVFSIFPRPAAFAAPAGVYVYGSMGKATVPARSLTDLAAAPADAKAVIIGAGALKAGEAPWAPKLAEFVAKGGTVLCLEQTEYPTDWLPVPVELDAKHSTTVAFVRAQGHPALAHVTDGDLRYAFTIHGSLLKPARGNFRPLIDAGGIRASIDDMNGLSWAPLLELPHGKGRYLLCQLPLSEQAGVEPVADILLRDLVRYAATAPPNETSRVALLADPDSSLKRTLDGMGLVYDSVLGSLSGESLAAHRVLIAGGGPAAWEAVRAQAAAFGDWVKQGGALWLNSLTPNEADVLAQLVGAPCELRTAEPQQVCLARADPLTMGMSNHELYWRDRPIWDQWTAMRKIMEWEPAALPPGAVALTDPPGLVRMPVGKGFVLLNQLLWDSTQQNRLEGTKIASILLTNLGAQMDLAPFARVEAKDFVPVDLAPYCNLGFAGDPDTGWMDHGPKALAGFPTGGQPLARAWFNIIDPAQNGGKSVIVLRGTTRPSYPAEMKGIPVNAQARALHFLHTCAWGRPDGGDAATYVVYYADGTEQRIPIRVGVEIADWYVDPHPQPAAQVAWTGHIDDKPGPIGAYAMRWVNPWPDKTITSIDLLSAQKDPVVVVFGVSVEAESKGTPCQSPEASLPEFPVNASGSQYGVPLSPLLLGAHTRGRGGPLSPSNQQAEADQGRQDPC
ncbi:MAG: hypothetical protein FJX75_20750 [Armatimonadetes bacterium]|nr:hypothetical protein [Armatimonadota bacterium]